MTRAHEYASFVAAPPTSVGLWLAKRLADKYARLIGKTRLKDAHVYEIGPGRGLFAQHCTKSRYIGIDSSPAVVAALRTNGYSAWQAAVPPIPGPWYPRIIFSASMVEHLSPETVADFFVAAKERLGVGGSLCLVAPDAMAMGLDFWRGHYTHQWPTCPRTLKQAARDAGFVVTQCRRFGLLPGMRHLWRAIPAWTEPLENLRLCLAPRIYLEAKRPHEK